jgi:hypothetical protein
LDMTGARSMTNLNILSMLKEYMGMSWLNDGSLQLEQSLRWTEVPSFWSWTSMHTQARDTPFIRLLNWNGIKLT